MPWVNKEMCTGCGVCVENCPGEAIQMAMDNTAVIDMNECIRCGECHEICPNEAVRHDKEKVPERTASNIETAVRLLEKCRSIERKRMYLEKYINALHIENTINETSIEKLEAMKSSL